MGLFTSFVLTKLRLFLQSCVGICRKMWIRNSMPNVLSPSLRSKKAIFLGIVVVVIVLYLFSSLFGGGAPKFLHRDVLARCLKDKLYLFENRVRQNDAVISRKSADGEEKYYLPYVGNGYIGASVDTDNGLYIKHMSSLTLPVKYYPIVHVEVDASIKREAAVTDFRAGLVYRYQCFQMHSNCLAVGSQLYAHRTRPSLLIQQVKIQNPTGVNVDVELIQMGMSDWKGAHVSSEKLPSKSNDNVEVSITVGTVDQPTQVNHPSSDMYSVVAIASTKVPKTVVVKGGSSAKFTVINVIEYQSSISKSAVTDVQKLLKEKVKEKMQATLLIDERKLQEEHTNVWTQLWQTGISISYSRAPGAINGEHINNTMYYVLSNTRSPIHEVDVTSSKKYELQKSFAYPDRCYDARHHTLQVPSLWENVVTESRVAELASRWLVTLEKQGCKSLIDAGADGVMLGMVLSMGGFQFKNYHLEFNTHPRDLHRDFTFRRLSYGNNTHLNITVHVRSDNKAVLYVALDRNDKPYYACDAGCIDQPVKLSEKQVQLPVKLTEPLTAVLYITSDHEHMTQLKDVLHVQSLEEAPAHEDHVMALHRHGHKYGGLPTIFWVSIVLLVVVFHLFLFKMIYNEYCSGNQERYGRTGKYNL